MPRRRMNVIDLRPVRFAPVQGAGPPAEGGRRMGSLVRSGPFIPAPRSADEPLAKHAAFRCTRDTRRYRHHGHCFRQRHRSRCRKQCMDHSAIRRWTKSE